MKNAGSADYNLELFEYAYLVEDTDPCATSMKIYVPKLAGTKAPGNSSNKSSVNQSMIGNSSDSTLQEASSAGGQSYITARVAMPLAHRHKHHDCPGNCINEVHSASTCHEGISCLKPCPHFHHDHHFPHVGAWGLIPKGSRVIVLFMNHDVNDAIITRLECKFPSGSPPGPPNEHR